MFNALPLPLSLIYLQGLEAATSAEALRDALCCDEVGQALPFDPLGQECLADTLPARFETLSVWIKDHTALIVAEDVSQKLTAWQGTGDDPFEALDEAFPADRLTVFHLDPAAQTFGLLLADDGVLLRRLYVELGEESDAGSSACVSTGRIDPHERSLWEASELEPPQTAEALLPALGDLQDQASDALQFVLTSMLADRLRRESGIDLFDASAPIWDESVVSFCLDNDDN